MRFKGALLGAAALAVLSGSLAGAASAQEFRGYDRGYERGYGDVRGGGDIDARLDRLAQWIRSSSERGSLDQGQTRRAWEQFRGIRQQEQYLRSRHGGWLNDWDRRQLETRIDRLTQFLRWANENGRRW